MSSLRFRDFVKSPYPFLCLSIFLCGFSAQSHAHIHEQLANLELSAKGRLGVYAINTANHEVVAYHSNERFPMCSTHKVMAVAAMLKASEASPNLLKTVLHYDSSDLVVWSPVTEKHLQSGMSFQALGRASITLSDNTAINLIIKWLGGPEAVTSFARSIGDERFALNRYEPELNSAIPGDYRDTSTPLAQATSLRQLVLGQILDFKTRKLLKLWLINNTTGDKRIRVGVPENWIVGDKTGTCGSFGAIGDIGIIWPKKDAPMIIAIYFTGKNKHEQSSEVVIAKAARLVIHAMNHGESK